MSRILIIDDDAPVRRSFRLVLTRAGHEVLEAADGCEGMTIFAAESVDLVITDIIMTNKDGIDVLLELRAKPQPVKVIVMSGAGCVGGKLSPDRARKLGADAVLEKPILREECSRK